MKIYTLKIKEYYIKFNSFNSIIDDDLIKEIHSVLETNKPHDNAFYIHSNK